MRGVANMYELRCEAAFDSAHFLSNYHGKCENLHGHRWRVEVHIASDQLRDAGDERGMVMDFGKVKSIVKQTAQRLDHTFLIEEGTLSKETISCLEKEGFSLTFLPFRTTAENLSKWFFDQLVAKDIPVVSVEIDETPNNRAVYMPFLSRTH